MIKANVNNKVNIHQSFTFEDSVYYFKIWILIKGISPWNVFLNQIFSTLKYLTRLLLNLPTWICVKNVLEVRRSVLFSVSVLNRHLHLQRQPWNGKIKVWNLKIPARHCSGFLIKSFKQASHIALVFPLLVFSK